MEKIAPGIVIPSLSLAADLANGNPMETALRVCCLSLSLAESLGADQTALDEIYFAAMLRFLGCTAYSHEESRMFGGDDIALRRAFAAVDSSDRSAMLITAVRELGKGKSPATRVHAISNAVLFSGSSYREMASSNCEVARSLALRLGMKESTARALTYIYERYDGSGSPGGISGEEIPFSIRVISVCYTGEICRQAEGVEFSTRIVRGRAGRQFDPVIAARFAKEAPAHFAALEKQSVWDIIRNQAPKTQTRIPMDVAAAIFADFSDLKSVYTLSHSSAAADLACRAGKLMGLSSSDLDSLKIATLLHDLGNASVPTGILEKRTALDPLEWERVRMHTYHTSRILSSSEALARYAEIASSHHERPDGSGYHRGISNRAMGLPHRILAGVEIYRSLVEERSYRPAYSPEQALEIFAKEMKAGRIDPQTGSAVLEAAGFKTAKRGRWPSGLSDREIEVLVPLARGLSNREIAARLGISNRTVQHHVIHIYNKINVSTRAAAALFASENNLL